MSDLYSNGLQTVNSLLYQWQALSTIDIALGKHDLTCLLYKPWKLYSKSTP